MYYFNSSRALDLKLKNQDNEDSCLIRLDGSEDLIVIQGEPVYTSLLAVAMTKHHEEQQLRRKEFSWLRGYNLSLGKAKAGTKAKTMEKCCFLSCSP